MTLRRWKRLLGAATLSFSLLTSSQSYAGPPGKVVVRGGYNGWGYQPGYTYDPQTGWARTTDGFNFRPDSGFTSPIQRPPIYRRGQYPSVQPRLRYNYGRPYLDRSGNFGNIRRQPPGGWLNWDVENWGK